MPTLIDRNGHRRDDWRRLDETAPVTTDAALLVPLAAWLADDGRLRSHPGRLGLVLGGADDLASAAADLARFELIAIEFPKFTDGRAYSIARALRDRFGWRGELRAVGEVLRDQLFYMARCGFDSFALADDEDANAALAHFEVFSDAYQHATDRSPLFMRRQAAAASQASRITVSLPQIVAEDALHAGVAA